MAVNAFAARCQDIDLPWIGLEAAIAAGGDRPIMCFFGQSLDAWSWRMADALDGDEAVRDLIHAAFTPVFCDPREATGPAALCQQVLALSAGASGWPACLFMLPDGRPFGAVPYSPMRDGDRRSGLATILVQIAEVWMEDSASLVAGAEAIAEHIAIMDALPDRPQRSSTLIIQACEAACIEAADTLEGGFGDAPRSIPHGPLQFMLQRILSGEASSALQEHFATTLNAIISGGIHDQLEGGFHRAAQDRTWSLPFFEKRCGDSAQLIPLLLDASEACGVDLYANIARNTGQWLISKLQGPDGFFRHGLHALCHGVNQEVSEGATYAWSQAGAAALIGQANAEHFATRFLSGPVLSGDFHVPNARGPLSAAAAAALPAACARLAMARNERPQPWTNEQILVEEQGMMLCALTRLSQWCHDHDEDASPWQAAAEKLNQAAAQLSPQGTALPQYIGGNYLADNRSLAWLALGRWRLQQHLQGDLSHPKQLAAALWAQRRSDGTLSIRCGALGNYTLSIGDNFPAVLDAEDSPSAAAIAAQLFHELAQVDDHWPARAMEFLNAHRPLMALSQLPTAGLAAVLAESDRASS